MGTVDSVARLLALSAGNGGSEPGETLSYNDLENKPQINGTTLTGNKTLDELGITAGNLNAYTKEETISAINDVADDKADKTALGNLSDLATDDKSSAVAAINEIKERGAKASNIDNLTITENENGEIQAVGVLNDKDKETLVKLWTGTKAEYDAIEEKDDATLYNITDDYEEPEIVANKTTIIDANSTDTQYPSAKAVYDIVQNGPGAALDDIVPKQTATDSIININDALKYKAFDFKVDGAYKQETYTGKNLANVISLYCPALTGSLENQEATINGTTDQNTNVTLNFQSEGISLKANQSYMISVICSGTVTGTGYKKLYMQVQDKSSVDLGNFASNNNTTYTYTPETDVLVKSINIDIALNQTFNNFKVKVQIEKGSTATDYEPYVGGVAVPNPNQPSEITTLNFDKITKIGQNLFDLSDTVNVSNNTIASTVVDDDGFIHVEIDNTNGSSEVFANYWTAPSKKLLPNHDYLIAVEVKEYNGNGYNNYIGTESVTQFKTGFSDSNKKTGIITGVVTTKDNFDNAYTMLRTFIECRAYSTVSITYRISILADLTVNQENFVYKPYQAIDYSINLQGNEMVSLPNGVKDEVQVDKEGNVSLIKKVGKKTFIDTDVADIGEDWFTLLAFSNVSKPLDYKGNGSYDLNYSYNNIITNRFSQSPSSAPRETYDKSYTIIPFMSSWSFGITFPKGTTLEQAREMITGTDMYYELAEPQTISLGKLSDIITTEQGSNTFAINGNIDTNISTTYALDLKKYIDNKISTVSQAVLEQE